MITKRIISGVHFCLVYISFNLTAQEIQIAFPGPKGMYVYTGPLVVTPETPMDGITGYKVERRETHSARWTTLKEVSAPASMAEFRLKLNDAITMFPDYVLEQYLDLDEIWEMAGKYRNIDSMFVYSSVVPVHLALGTMILDDKVRNGRKYQYRVHVKKDNQWQQLRVSQPQVYELPRPVVNMSINDKSELLSSISFELGIFPRSNIVLVHTYRRTNFRGGFALVQPESGYTINQDSLFVLIRDQQLETNTAYEYVFRAYDFFGNVIQLPDTIFARTFSTQTIHPPYNMSVDKISGVEGNVLKWKLDHPGRISNIGVYRSVEFDGEYSLIGDASPADTMFIDELADPMIHYWYYLEMTDITGSTSVQSAKIFARYSSGFLPSPPGNITVYPVEGGVAIHWDRGEPHTRGYYVYRKLPQQNQFELISTLVEDTLYIDKSNTLKGNQAYQYVVQSENTSFQKSGYSEIMAVFPGIVSIPSAPGGLQLTAESHLIKLVWEPVNVFDPSITGYLVYKRENNNPNWTQVSTFPVQLNHFNDSLVTNGNTYEYTVRSIDFRGTMSDITTTVKHHIPYQGVYLGPPADFKATVGRDLIHITWQTDERTQVAGYRIYRKVAGAEYELIQTIEQFNEPSYLDTTVIAGNLYLYQVVSFDKEGMEGLRSKAVTVWF